MMAHRPEYAPQSARLYSLGSDRLVFKTIIQPRHSLSRRVIFIPGCTARSVCSYSSPHSCTSPSRLRALAVIIFVFLRFLESTSGFRDIGRLLLLVLRLTLVVLFLLWRGWCGKALVVVIVIECCYRVLATAARFVFLTFKCCMGHAIYWKTPCFHKLVK